MTDSSSTDIATKTLPAIQRSGFLPPDALVGFDEYLQSTSGQAAAIVKYRKGKWTIGIDQTPILIGTRMAFDITSPSDGHVKWENKRPVDSAMQRVIAGPPPARDTLGDLDEALWPPDPISGKPRDLWARTMSIVLKDIESWEEGVYSTSSVGGINAIGKLLRNVRAGIAKGQTGVPIAALETDSYEHHEYGEVHTPVLRLVEWRSEVELMGGEPDVDSDLEDEIPF
jgi:hypothetical protein